jgi:hypothetical protein
MNMRRDSFAGNFSVKDLAAPKWGERYLDEILGALAKYLGSAFRAKPLRAASPSQGNSSDRLFPTFARRFPFQSTFTT